MLLAPGFGRQQIIQRGNRFAPGHFEGSFEKLGVLIHHAVDDRQKSFVARKDAVPAGEQIALQPTLAVVFAQHFEDAAIGADVFAILRQRPDILPVGRFENRADSIGFQFIGANDAEVARAGIQSHHVAQVFAKLFNAADMIFAARLQVDSIILHGRQFERTANLAAECVRVQRHAALALGTKREKVFAGLTVRLEKFLRPVRPQPGFDDLQMVGIALGILGRHLMGAERSLHRVTVDCLRSAPTFRRAQNNHRPARPVDNRTSTSTKLDFANLAVRGK